MFVVCCVLFAVCSVLFVVFWLLFVGRGMCCAVCVLCALCVDCCATFVVCLFFGWRSVFASCCVVCWSLIVLGVVVCW